MVTIAFDIYGTLINPHGIVTELEQLIGNEAHAFSITWREKQLEYSFRRGLMQRYVDFTTCTRQALDFTILQHGVEVTAKDRESLMAKYDKLPAFPEAKAALEQLSKQDYRLFAFSNGNQSTVECLLQQADIRDTIQGVVSVNDIQSYKPNPQAYAYFIRIAEANPENTWLVSSNPFDVIGACSVGLKGLWIRRSEAMVFDPWEIEPTAIVESLAEVPEAIEKASGPG